MRLPAGLIAAQTLRETRLVQVIFPWNSKSASKLWAREKKGENEGGRVGVSLCLSYRQIPGFLKGKPACRPTGTAPEKISNEAR